MTYRELSASPGVQQDYSAFLDELKAELSAGRKDPNDLVRDTLFQLYFGPVGVRPGSPDKVGSLSMAARTTLHSLDPRNVTTEPEYYTDIDINKYLERKPFIWLWQMFDRSPIGQNALFALPFRRLLAPLIFKKVGRNFKCWHLVEWSFGYNLSFGDDVVVHRHVLLDDRGGIDIGDRVSISDYANIYSHSHDIDDISKVYTRLTSIDAGSRITFHATVLSGIKIGENAMVGTGAVVTSDVEPYHIVVGIPAKTVKIKNPAQ